MISDVKIPLDSELVADFEAAKRGIEKNLKLSKLPNNIDPEHYRYFNKYFSKLIQGILGKDAYPLDHYLVREIHRLSSGINKLGQILQRQEEQFGETYLKDLIYEQNYYGPDLPNRLRSMQSELVCNYFLSCIPGITFPKKITFSGDLQFNVGSDEWNIEVKRVLDEYSNLRVIAEAFIGSLYLMENELLRSFQRIKIGGSEIDDTFRRAIIEFIHSNKFSDLLKSRISDEEVRDGNISIKVARDYIKKGTPGTLSDGKTPGDKINVWVIFSYEDNERRRTLELTLKQEDRLKGILRFEVLKIPLSKEKFIKKIQKGLDKIKYKYEQAKKLNYGGYLHIDVSPYVEENISLFTKEIDQLLEEKLDCIPCVVFLHWWFVQQPAVSMNQAAKKTVLRYMATQGHGGFTPRRACPAGGKVQGLT